jgi:hypothetical protein
LLTLFAQIDIYIYVTITGIDMLQGKSSQFVIHSIGEILPPVYLPHDLKTEDKIVSAVLGA